MIFKIVLDEHDLILLKAAKRFATENYEPVYIAVEGLPDQIDDEIGLFFKTRDVCFVTPEIEPMLTNGIRSSVCLYCHFGDLLESDI